MPFKQFRDGEVLTANDVDMYWLQQIHVIKPSDETVTSSVTLQNDDHLTLPLLADSDYLLEFLLRYDAIQAADLKIAWSYPAGTVMNWTHGGLRGGATGTLDEISRTALDQTGEGWIGGPAAASGTNAMVMGEGRVTTAGTAGNLQLRWAQNTSNATGSIMRANSILMLVKLTR